MSSFDGMSVARKAKYDRQYAFDISYKGSNHNFENDILFVQTSPGVLKMNIAFVTCVQIGLSCMERSTQLGELALAITLNNEQATGKAGRVYIDAFCDSHNIPLHKSSHVNNVDVIEILKNSNIDWLFIIGWSQIASKMYLRR